jgi:hypothetical protein
MPVSRQGAARRVAEDVATIYIVDLGETQMPRSGDESARLKMG